MDKQPSAAWQAEYAKKIALLSEVSDFNAYFAADVVNIAGVPIDRLSLGKVSLPTGRVLVRDPLVDFAADAESFWQSVPSGEYEALACVVKPFDGDCARIAAVRVQFSPNEAVRFENALTGSEDLSDVQAGDFFGFAVDAGLACIADSQAHQAVLAFEKDWYAKNPEGNLYDDYFAALFTASAKAAPLYQREEGDYINWQVPNTDLHIPIFQSGYGDGYYPVYFGFDKQGKICQLIVQFFDIEMCFDDDEEADEE